MAKHKTGSATQEHDNAHATHQIEGIPDVNQQSEDSASIIESSAGVDIHNKASLVRAALARGFTKPREGCRWIRDTYGVEVEGTYFSVAKSQEARRVGAPPQSRSHSSKQSYLIADAAPSRGVPDGFGVDVKIIRGLLAGHGNEVDAVKDLVATIDTLVRKYGVQGLHEMIDAFFV